MFKWLSTRPRTTRYLRDGVPWEAPGTSLADAVLAEIDAARAKGLEWDLWSHSWHRPKDRQKTARQYLPNAPVTAVDIARNIWRGARVVGPDPTPEDSAAIDADAARWRLEIVDGVAVWRRVVVEDRRRQCESCTADNVPEWRRGGKTIEVTLPDGSRRQQCHYCGRVAEPNGTR